MIREYLKAFNILSEEEIEDFVEFGTIKKLKKLDFFIRENYISKEVAFINSGIFRSFYSNDKGKEITYCITFPNNLLTAYSSFITQKKTVENIQAISDAELIVFPKEKIDQLVNQGKNWLMFMKILAEQEYIALENRFFQLQSDRAEQRYRDLLENHPEYLQQIPLQYLASYLGITQRHLSRLRKQIKN